MKHSFVAIVALLIAPGCDNWPRHAHIPAHNDSAISTDEPPSSAIEIQWSESNEIPEPNNAPGAPTALGMGEGIQISGTLIGSGWDPSASPESFSDCGDPLAFPPDAPGTYTGDIEWVVVEALEAATLCAAVHLEDTSLSFDLTMYVLDDCGAPVEVFVDNDGPIGIARTGGNWLGQVVVPSGTQVGIALGSYAPDDPDLATDWTITAALVPPLTDIDLCPDLP